jgi:hypothetical protein
MQILDPIERSRGDAPTVLQTDQARQGVTGHNVRYVLGFGLLGAVVVFAVLGILAALGWLGGA